MTTPAQKPPGAGGGSVAIRGFLAQTLVALLDLVQVDPPVTEITLEPALGDEQFDFVWKDSTGTYATQVKSTTNYFKKADVEKWARKLEAARSTEQCRLMLVGQFHLNLQHVRQVGKVAIEKKNIDLPGLLNEAAQGIAMFRGAAGLEPRPGTDNLLAAKALVTQLELYATESRTLSREAFIKLLREWVTVSPREAPKFDISRIIKHAPAELIGREDETKLLSNAWAKVCIAETPRPRVLTFFGLGGEGKTSLVAKWAGGLAGENWPRCDAAFAWSFYSQGTRDQTTTSSDTFLKEALIFFGDVAMAGSAQGTFDKGRRLAQLVGERRALLILDGLEPLQYAPTSPLPGELKDQGIAALLKGLATASQGLCVVTTRYSIPDLRAYWQTTAPEVKLKRLSLEAGVALLQFFGVKGSLRKTIPSADGRGLLNEFEALVEDVKGHALTLNLLGSYLRDAHAGDIRKRDLVKLEEADTEEQGGHAFRVMDAYVKALEGTSSPRPSPPLDGGEGAQRAGEGETGQRALALLRLLGLFDRPATADCLEALWKAPAIVGLTEPLIGLSEAQRNVAFSRLESAKLLTVNRNAAGTLLSLDAHPLLREYFARAARSPGFSRSGAAEPPKGGTPSEAWRAAHRRLYEHLCATTPDKPQPTLEDLQPLYQAVAHGCQAGLQQDACGKVYRDRINRGKEQYAPNKLGAWGSELGAIACFFETPWSRVSPALTGAAQAWLLNEAATRLRALGRLTEALEPIRASREMCVHQKDWGQAAIRASNLSELELTLGELAGAVGDAEQSVTYADRSGDGFCNVTSRASHADALHQAGRRAEADAHFRKAEALQGEIQPGYPLLYSLRGFNYCDLLLMEAERAVCQHCLSLSPQPSTLETLGSCRAVEQRVKKMFKWRVPSDSILEIALDSLTLGRAALYAAILGGRAGSTQPAATGRGEDTAPDLATALRELDAAVAGLRSAGTTHHIPRALLTRAWLRSLTGARTGPESAQSDLDEAWEIAQRGPMPLFLADIHLHRARLFGRMKDEGRRMKEEPAYPWESPQADLAEARRLIYKHGYLRRKEELEDAEEAFGLRGNNAR
jgi:tetratricopeptide (TPR) repeat protein